MIKICTKRGEDDTVSDEIDYVFFYIDWIIIINKGNAIDGRRRRRREKMKKRKNWK